MSFSITITEKVRPALREAAANVSDRTLMKVGARALVDALRAHFFKFEQSRPNKHNWPRQHFWAQVARSVQKPQDTADGVLVSINQVGIAQRYFGGLIRPVNAKRLTIPARAEAYGKRAREFNNLHYVRFRSGAEALVEADAAAVHFQKTKSGTKTIQGANQGGLVMFWLKKSVTQAPDPTVLPTAQEMETTITIAAEDYLKRQIERASNAS